MKSYKKEIEELKKVLMTYDNFGDIFNFFFDNLVETSDFMDQGKIVKNKLIKKNLQLIAKARLDVDEIEITHLLLRKIKGTPLIHGPFFLNDLMGMVFYFEDIKMGLFSLNTGVETLFFRITTTVPDGDDSVLESEEFEKSEIGEIKLIASHKSKSVH